MQAMSIGMVSLMFQKDYAAADQWTTFVGEGKRVSLMPVAEQPFLFLL